MSSISLSALSAATSRVLNLLTRPTELASSPTLICLSFNQDRGYFTVGTNSGFRIYECNPLGEIFRGDDLLPSLPPAGISTGGGGIGIVKMVFRCNLLALAGGGPNPQYPLNQVMIWDHQKLQCVRKLPFGTEVKSIRLRMDSIVIVFLQKILIYEFPILKLEHEIETFLNPRGLCEVSQTWGSWVLACPGLQKGGVRVEHYGSNVTKYIMMAHDSSIACLALTDDGRFLATASSKGTLIRVFDTLNGSLLKEVRRGADRAEIYSLAFNSTAQWLAASSSKGTIHVFSLRLDHASLTSGTSDGASEPDNSSPLAVSNLSFVKGFLPKYFGSEWSVAQFHLQEGLQSIVAFGLQKYTVMILGMDGSFYRCQFDPETGGEMTQLEHHNFL